MWSKWFLGSTGNHRLLRTGLCTAFNQSGRVAVAAARSNVELLRLQQSGGREGNCGGSAVAVLDRGRCARAARWIPGHYFLSPFLTVPLLRLRVSLGGF